MTVPFDDHVPYLDRVLGAYLDALGYGARWNAKRDLALVQGLLSGNSVDAVAASLKVPRRDVIIRYKRLNRHIGDIDHQRRLVAALKARAALEMV
jgi:hypothetical protein